MERMTHRMHPGRERGERQGARDASLQGCSGSAGLDAGPTERLQGPATRQLPKRMEAPTCFFDKGNPLVTLYFFRTGKSSPG
jgi:hypothetical protein